MPANIPANPPRLRSSKPPCPRTSVPPPLPLFPASSEPNAASEPAAPPPPPAQPSTAPGQPRRCDSRDSPTTTPARLDASAPAELATPTVRGGQPWLPQAASAPTRTGVAWRPAGHRQPARPGRPLPPAHLAGDRIPVPGDGDRGSTDGDGNRRTSGSRWRRSQGARQRTIEMSGQPQRVSHPVNRVCHMDDLSNPLGLRPLSRQAMPLIRQVLLWAWPCPATAQSEAWSAQAGGSVCAGPALGDGVAGRPVDAVGRLDSC